MADGLSLENLSDYLQSECEAITKDIESELKESAEALKETIKEQSPVRSERYKEGWTVTKQQSAGNVSFVVRNKTSYQLTHLLEHGHDNPLTGERTEGIPHINDNADKAVRKCGDSIDKIIRKG